MPKNPSPPEQQYLSDQVKSQTRFPWLSLRDVEDLLHERGIEISYEAVRIWWNRFGPLFAAEIRKPLVR